MSNKRSTNQSDATYTNLKQAQLAVLLRELAANPDIRTRVEADPLSFLIERGVQLSHCHAKTLAGKRLSEVAPLVINPRTDKLMH